MGLFSKLFHHDDSNLGTKKVIKIRGMICANCVKHVTKLLEAVDGVNSVDVNLMEGQATVYVSDNITDEVLKAIIREAGYTPVSVS